jgi:hypothetical protein
VPFIEKEFLTAAANKQGKKKNIRCAIYGCHTARQNCSGTDAETVLVMVSVVPPRGVLVLRDVHATRLLEDWMT